MSYFIFPLFPTRRRASPNMQVLFVIIMLFHCTSGRESALIGRNVPLD